MKILVLGGGGFLGSHLVEQLLTSGFSVRVFERPNLIKYRVFSPHESIEWFEGDFLNPDNMATAVKGCDLVYHLIATTLPQSSNKNPVYDVETNISATLHLLNQLRHAQAKKIIFLSSGGTVYGVPQAIPLTEDHVNMPLCSYGITKLAIEKYLHLYHHLYGLDYCILRLANPFGERQRSGSGQGAVAAFLDSAINDRVIEIWGDGSVIRDYIYVQDVVAAMYRAISYQGTTRVFNIGSGRGLSLNEIVMAIEALLGKPLQLCYAPARPLDVPVNVLAIDRARQLLDWEPRVMFTEGLERTCRFLLGTHNEM